MSRWLEHLNPEQRQAVEQTEGPLLVLAGAGSGKTRVITHRIAHLMSRGVAAENILAVTFTNKAAEEMRHRLAGMVGAGLAKELTMSTFHALGLSMLRAEAARKGGRGKRFVIFDTGDQLSTLREAGRRLKFDRSFDLGSILTRISAYKNAFVEPGTASESEDAYEQAASALYPVYQELLGAYAAVDFDDLVCAPCRMMEADPECRRRWAERYRYVLVDEYQDTNGAQLRMLRNLAGEHRNLCVVGDDDQSIYGWRGAQVRNILEFARDFKGAKTVYLMRNYRSVPAVLDLANAIIAENPDRHEKQMIATRRPGQGVKVVVTPDGDKEAAWVAEHLRKAVDKGRYRRSEMAVLYRSNLLARGLETELRVQGIPYRVVGGAAFYEGKEVKDILAYLRACHNLADEISVRRVINCPPRGIGLRTIAKLTEWADAQSAPFHQALQRAPEVLGEGDRSAAAIQGFLALLERHRAVLRRGGKQLPAAVRRLLAEVDYAGKVQTEGGGSEKAVGRRLAQIEALLAQVERYCEREEQPSLGEYLNRTALLTSAAEEASESDDRVTLSTLHGSKGLEFRLVVLVGVEEGFLPHDRTMNPHSNDLVSGDLAEERRLFYVGLTRAMDELVLTRAAERVVRGKPQPRTPSRFLDNVPPELLASNDLTKEPEPAQLQGMLAALRAKLGA